MHTMYLGIISYGLVFMVYGLVSVMVDGIWLVSVMVDVGNRNIKKYLLFNKTL